MFQHCNDKSYTFSDSKRAAYDANRALDMAENQLHQPKNTIIFFGVDYDAVRSDEVANIRAYFHKLNLIIASKYKIGVYGSGHVCEALKTETSYCWLSQSAGFLGSKSYDEDKKWSIKQCGGRMPFSDTKPDFDPDILNVEKGDIGFWKSN